LQFVGDTKPADNELIDLDTTKSSATDRKAADCQRAYGERTERDCS
jgi:hypothetical protein